MLDRDIRGAAIGAEQEAGRFGRAVLDRQDLNAAVGLDIAVGAVRQAASLLHQKARHRVLSEPMYSGG